MNNTWSTLVRVCVKDEEDGDTNLKLLERDKIFSSINDIGVRQSTALHFVALGTNLKLLEWLFANGVIIQQNEDGETALHWACKTGSSTMVQKFLSEMTLEEIQLPDSCGETALDWAIEYEHKAIVNLINEEINSKLSPTSFTKLPKRSKWCKLELSAVKNMFRLEIFD